MNEEIFVLKELNDSDYSIIIHECQMNNVGVELYLNGKTRLQYLPNALAPDKENWLRRKRNTVLRFGMSTLDFYEKNDGNEDVFELKYGLNRSDYTSTPGSIPVFIEKTREVGTLTITGLAPEEDHEFALKLVNRFR